MHVGRRTYGPRVGIAERVRRAAREARKRAGLQLIDLEGPCGLSEGQLSRFEAGEAWPRDWERVIAGYEEACGLAPDELWRRALDMS